MIQQFASCPQVPKMHIFCLPLVFISLGMTVTPRTNLKKCYRIFLGGRGEEKSSYGRCANGECTTRIYHFMYFQFPGWASVKSHSSYLCYTLIFLCPHNVLLVMFVVLFICEQKLMTVLVTTDNGI